MQEYFIAFYIDLRAMSMHNEQQLVESQTKFYINHMIHLYIH